MRRRARAIAPPPPRGPCSPAHAARRRGSRSRSPDFTVDACRGGRALRTANSISRGGGASLSTPRTRRVSAWRPGGAGGARLRGPWEGHDRPNFGRPAAADRPRIRITRRGASSMRGNQARQRQWNFARNSPTPTQTPPTHHREPAGLSGVPTARCASGASYFESG